jgi:rRNA biogenesis protein RRP5
LATQLSLKTRTYIHLFPLVNDEITARITAVFPSADPRRATLSALPHIVNLDVAKTASGQAPLEALPIGFLIEAAKVVKIIENQGVYVDIGVDGFTGFVHVHLSSLQRLLR